MTSILKALLHAAQAQAEAIAPYESCGLLLGYDGVITELRECENVAAKDKRRNFELDPQCMISAQREARESKIDVMGVWHSHPGGQAVVSDRDKQSSVYKNWYWLVTATGEHAGHALFKAGEDPHDLRPTDFKVVAGSDPC